MAIVNHIGIIVDGNGRWAKEKGLSRSDGHLAGSKNMEKIIKYIAKNEIANYLSLYVFSTENFKRSEQEVKYLMDLFLKWFKKFQKESNKYNIKVVFSGHREYLENNIKDTMLKIEDSTKNNNGLVVNFCLSYGGRTEIVDTTKKIVQMVLDNKINIQDIDENLFNDNLYNKLPDVDFLIRTSGEQRISNFMLWQISYAEVYFPKTYFPDFDSNCLDLAIEEYLKRDRRFGQIKTQ